MCDRERQRRGERETKSERETESDKERKRSVCMCDRERQRVTERHRRIVCMFLNFKNYFSDIRTGNPSIAGKTVNITH